MALPRPTFYNISIYAASSSLLSSDTSKSIGFLLAASRIFSISSINTNNVFKKTFDLLDNTLLIDYNKGYLSEPFHIQFLEKNGFARSDWWFILSDGPPIIEITVHYKNKEGDFVPGQGKVILTKNFKK